MKDIKKFLESLSPEELEILQQGKDFWGDVGEDGGYITGDTLKFLIESVIENTWMNAHNYFRDKNK